MEGEGLVRHESNWREMHSGLAAHLAAMVSVFAWLCAFTTLSRGGGDTSVVSLTILLAALSLWICLSGSLGAAWRPRLLVASVLIWALAGLLLLRDGSFAPWLAVPVVMSAVVMGYWAGLLVTVLSVIATVWFGTAILPDAAPQPWPVALLGLMAVVCLWVYRGALNKAWSGAEQAAELARQVRARQEQVNRLNKSLQVSNGLLKRANLELDQARHEADEARRLKSEFAANISHELRTPLNLILGFTEIMSRAPEVYGPVNWTDTLRSDLAEVRRSARYLSDLVDDILDLARIDGFHMPIHREPTDVREVAQEAADIVAGLMRGKPLRLDCLLPDLPLVAPLDRTRIRQVLLNLLTNAIRFTESGCVTISACESGGEVVVRVADTGRGIPEEHLRRVFDEFEQVSAWRRPAEGGKGLGLAVAKHLVQLHGGRIWAESAVGVGSVFSFTLPRHVKTVSRLRPPGVPGRPAGGAPDAVVVVDEDGLAAEYLRRHLDGYAIARTGDIEEACGLAAELRPRAMVVNLLPGDHPRCPNTAAYPALAGVPIIGCSLPSRQWLAQAERFTRCLAKPVSADALVKTVHELAPTGTVLVVDDERAFVKFVQRAFQSVGEEHRLVCVSSGGEALAWLSANTPSLILLDVVLGDIDGFALADQLRASPDRRQVPIVAVTGANLGEDALATWGESIVLSRPSGYSGSQFLAIIRAAIEAGGSPYLSEW